MASSPTQGAWTCRHGVDGRDWCPECYRPAEGVREAAELSIARCTFGRCKEIAAWVIEAGVGRRLAKGLACERHKKPQMEWASRQALAQPALAFSVKAVTAAEWRPGQPRIYDALGGDDVDPTR